MIGCVITGPGEFAPGLSLAVEMSAGKQEKFEVVAFREDQPLELYESNLRQAIESLQQDTEGVIVFSDLLASQAVNTGKEGIQNPQLAELSNQVEEVDTEGI